MKLIAKETFEQGLQAKFGGTFKVKKGVEYAIEQKDGETTVQVDGKPRLLNKELTEKLLGLGYIELQG